MTARILHVIDHTGPGGAQVVVYNLLRALCDRFSFGVAVLGEAGSYSAEYRALGVPVYELGRGHSRWNPASLTALIRCVRAEQFDLVHTHLFKSAVLGALAARWTARRCVLHDHTGVYPDSLEVYIPNRLARRLYLLAYRGALKVCQQVLVLTPGMLQAYAQTYPADRRKFMLLPNAIDVDRADKIDALQGRSIREELGLPPAAKLIVMVGRLEYEKDVKTFLRVAQQVALNASTAYAFLIAGSGGEEQNLRQYAGRLRLDNVFFLGYRQDVPALIRQSDALLLTSRREPFGLVILEAMAAGCPVIATRSGGPEAIITDGVNGLLADVGDVRGLVHGLRRLTHDETLRNRLIAAARRLVRDQYTLAAMANRLAEVYDAHIGQR